MTEIVFPERGVFPTLENCKLCAEGKRDVGHIGEHASVVYKSGTNALVDWLITLQKRNVSDPERGFTLLLLPIGHYTAFSQLFSLDDFASLYGTTFAKANYALQVVRQEEWKGTEETFAPTVVAYGKCASALNTQNHLHMKIYTLDGTVNQPSPSDTEWGKRAVLEDAQGTYVRAGPVQSTPLSQERFTALTRRLMDILND